MSTLNALYRVRDDSIKTASYSIALVKLNKKFWKYLIAEYDKDPQWARVKAMIEKNNKLCKNAAVLPYKVINSLIYYKDSEVGLQLRISAAKELEKKLFRQTHDELRHLKYTKTHEYLNEELYFFNMLKKFYEFIWACFECQLCQTLRHKLYNTLQSILISSQSFHIISLNFILELFFTFTSEYFDCIISITDKFSKAVSFISEKTTWDRAIWVMRLFNCLLLMNWGLLKAILTDRDLKFVVRRWKKMFKQLKIKSLLLTVYYSQTDKSSEITNQTVEIALQYYLTMLNNTNSWVTVLS